MLKNYRSILFKFDIIGTTPQIYIFNNIRYKSVFSSLLSLIIFLFSFAFSIFSLCEYLKYESPVVVFSKGNDEETKREIFFKDSPFVFQLIDSTTLKSINSSVAYYEADYYVLYYNGSYFTNSLIIDKCEFGKNIDSKYENLIIDKSNYGREIGDFYCINPTKDNLSLFYYPNIAYSSFNLYIVLKNNSDYIPEKIQTLIVSESDLIEHNNKDNPMKKNYIYHFTSSYNSLEYTKINYNFQYIKYESDDGFFYKKSEILSGLTFSDMSFYRNDRYEDAHNSRIGTITFEINKSHFDNYKRTYKRLQSLLAEIMSVISLLFEIGKQISFILCDKIMSKDIIKSLLNMDEIDDIINHTNKNIINTLFNTNQKNDISSQRKIAPEIMEKANNTNYLENNNNIKINEKINKVNLSHKVLKKINYYHIIKSYFCFNDKRTKLINLCHDIIIDDMCAERILKRFYNLETIYNYYFLNEEIQRYNNIKNNRFKEVFKYIYKLNNENKQFSKDNKINNDIEHIDNNIK